MFLLVPAYPGCPGQTAVKWLLLLLYCYDHFTVIIIILFIDSTDQSGRARVVEFSSERREPTGKVSK